MRKVLIRKIANTLLVNHQLINEPGLIKGQFGIILFFYYYGRYTQNEYYTELAEEFTEQVYTKVPKNYSLDIENGVGGIIWAIDYLKRYGFLELDDDFFDEMDPLFQADYLSDIKINIAHNSCFYTKGFYAIVRNKEEDIEECLQACYRELGENQELDIPTEFINCLLYFYIKAKEKVTFPYYDEFYRLLISRLQLTPDKKETQEHLLLTLYFLKEIGYKDSQELICRIKDILSHYSQEDFSGLQEVLAFIYLDKIPPVTLPEEDIENLIDQYISGSIPEKLSLTGIAWEGIKLIVDSMITGNESI